MLGKPYFIRMLALLTAVNKASTLTFGGLYDWKISVVSEVLSGPLRGGTLVVHLDDAIPRDVQQAIMALDAVQETPHVTLSLGVNETWWPDQQVPVFMHGSSVLHLVLFLTNPTKFLQSLWLNWKPRNLLLFSLARSSDSSILNHDVFNSVQKLALITEPSDEVHGRTHTMGVYTLQPFSSSTPKFLGEWNKQHYSKWDSIFKDRYPTFDGYRFELATWYDDPLCLYQINSASDDSRVGVSLEMLDTLSSRMNFTYTTTLRSPDLKWGTVENGSWNGLLGVIQRKEKNFTVNCYYQTANHLRDFDISTSYRTDGYSAFLLRPQPLPQWLNIYRPFQPQVWAVLAAITLFSMGVMILMERVGGQPFLGGVVATWLYLQRGVFGQGVPALPRALWQRMFLGIWYLYCLLVSVYYTSNLIAFFTSPANPQRIQTLQQLVNSDYRLVVEDSGVTLTSVLKDSQNDLFRMMRNKLELVPRLEDAVTALVAGTHALLASDEFGSYKLTVQHKVCGWYMVREQIRSGYFSWLFPKYTPWKIKFDHGIQRLVETGLVQHWKKVQADDLLGQDCYYRQQQESAGQQTNMVLTLQHLQGAFYILILGWAASVAVFLLELLRHRCSRCYESGNLASLELFRHRCSRR